MFRLATRRCWLACCTVFGLLGQAVFWLPAQEDAQAKRRLEVMQAAVGSLEPESSELKAKSALALASKPLLGYSDPTRGGLNEAAANTLLDAGVWRLGTEGRPTALVTVEIYPAAGKSLVLAFEFLSLTDAKFSLKHKTVEKVRWDATGSALTLRQVSDAPMPAATATARLTQMRQLARRFAVTERVNNDSIECRLLAQPIDRYQSVKEKVVDGAIFAYANGTNPEVGIVFEADGERWLYGTLRLSAAQLRVTLDGREVAAYDPFNARGRTDGAYNNASYKLDVEK